MSIFLEEELARRPTEKQPALTVPPIHGVRPYSGFRNPLTRSEVARRVSTTFRTRATKGSPEVYHFESLAEYATALDVLLDPKVYGIEVQLAPVMYRCRYTEEWLPHHFDMRITFEDGLRRAVFVRNATSLAKPETKAEIEDIFAAIPCDFADEAIVVNGDLYTRAYRDNLFRVHEAFQISDNDADKAIERAAFSTSFWSLKDLIRNSGLPSPRGFDAALRMIGRGDLAADWYSVIWIHSRVQLKA
ncbi:hypothetical protein [Lentibacter sp. XHP0401]|uniref:hypothetical protein n=1 Tax=Lentibacter sp. XHP0401 TaxID=2984334 RepID=UPI0021E8A137|nr:hypothetical protein [Lentibacter sp. XHP0401]MCV2893728.1 hypothetical protein [Lentibacter sp. XHP0401]